MADHSPLPNWVRMGDGRTEPFDGDRISRALFAAGERLGRPNPFLARELTDGVLHFLVADGSADPIPNDELVEIVVKIVRELGQPALALAFKNDRTTHPSPSPDRDDVPKSGSQSPLPPDLSAAERDGLFQFFDHDPPLKLAGIVLPPPSPAEGAAGRAWIEALEQAREQAGQFIAIDGPEYSLAGPEEATAWVQEFRPWLRVSGLRAVVNLNVSVPPARAAGGGPLFGPPTQDDSLRRSDVAEAIAEHCHISSADFIRVDWHLGDGDFLPAARERLLRLARLVLDGAPLAFVPDRPTRPVALAEGLDRRHPAVLAVVGLGLPRLLDIVRPAGGAAPEGASVLAKLGSLARLALSAGRARRDFLRHNARPVVSREFLLDRARLVVAPVGLAAVVREVTGHSPAETGDGLEFARHVLHGLHAAISLDAARGPAVVDNVPSVLHWDDDGCSQSIGIRQLLRSAAVLHAAVGTGTAVVPLPADRPMDPEEVAHLFWYAWQQPGLVRVRFVTVGAPPRQPTADW